ncbi:MAG: hypothetical protein KC900_09885 [Candidatus Omnitrophica bacterium]|nr:hypothetical protein [Candidatus Omnitrophota bacterium]
MKKYIATSERFVLTGFPETQSELDQEFNGIPVWKRTKWLQQSSLEELAERYGKDSCFVLIYRYPTDCYESLVDLNSRRGYHTHAWLPSRRESDFLQWWSESYVFAIEVLSKLPFKVVFSYEEFCHDPIKYRNIVCQNFGIVGENEITYKNDELLTAGSLIKEDEKTFRTNFVNASSVFRAAPNEPANILYNEILLKIEDELE